MNATARRADEGRPQADPRGPAAQGPGRGPPRGGTPHRRRIAQGLDALSKMTAVQSITKRVCAAQTSGISVALMEGVERGVADLIERLDALDAH